MLKLIKNNSYLIKKIDYSIYDFKQFFFQKKIEKYDWFYIKDYYKEFYKDFNLIIQNEKELNEIFYNCLSKNRNFDLNILDNNFDLMMNNSYFKKRIRINMEDVNIQNFKDNEFLKMNKNKFLEFMISMINKNKNDENIYNLFSKFGNLNSQEEFENNIHSNIKKISKERIYKLSLFMSIDKIYLQYLNNNRIFQNIKIIDISNYNFNQMNNLNIICPNIEELNLKVNEQNCDLNELTNIFPNMNILNIFIKTKFNVFNLLRNIRNSNIENLKLYIDNFDENIKIDSKIILKQIKNLKIEGNSINILVNFFSYIELPNLTKYIINIDLNKINNELSISNNSDYNIINQFIMKTINNKDKFCLNTFFSLPNKFKKIRYVQLNFKIFIFKYKKKRGKNYLFKFNINNKNEFKQYYSNLDLSINENEIIKYKKIDIKGINNKTNIEEIIEKDDINLCDIYFNLNIKKYFIKSFKNISSIFSENEINRILLNYKGNLNNLKYINLNIGDDLSNNSNLYDNLSQLIKSINLKSLILRLPPNNFNKNIILLFQLIQNSKKLRTINITKNNDNPIYDLNIKTILKQFPKLEKRKYNFDEFIIGNEILVLKKYPIIIYEIRKDLLGKKINLLGNENEEIIKTSKLFLNNKKIKSINHEFSNEGIYKLKVILKESLFNMRNLFYNCCSLTSLNLSNFNINNVYDMSHMFDNCYSLHYLNLSNFITNDVKNMSNMFDNCRSLTSLNLNNFNTNNVNNMSHMFYNCCSLTSLNLSNFNTNNVKEMDNMFAYCSSLTSLNLSNFITNNVTNMNRMFFNCCSLNSLNLSNFNIDLVKNMRNIFDGLNKNCNVILNNNKILMQTPKLIKNYLIIKD